MNDSAEAFITKSRGLLSEEYLPKIERCLENLTDEQVWWRPNPESNSIGNLLLHLAGNARQWIVCGIEGKADDRVRQQEFDERSVIPAAELLMRIRSTVDDVDQVLRQLDPCQLLGRRKIQGCDVSVSDAIYHVVEHFSMHTGQIILLTKLLKSIDLGFYDFSGGVPSHTWKH